MQGCDGDVVISSWHQPPPCDHHAHHVVIVVANVAEALNEFAEHPVAWHKVVNCLQGLCGTQLDARRVTACSPTPGSVVQCHQRQHSVINVINVISAMAPLHRFCLHPHGTHTLLIVMIVTLKLVAATVCAHLWC